jgi:ABC-2 type transport system ATP-binding protein
MVSVVASERAIQARSLERRFGDFVAVDHIDLDIGRGEIYGFLGPNGAGKTTTVRMLVTLLAPTSGEAWVAGHNITTEPEEVRLKIGVALQGASLDPKQTGVEFLRLQGRLYGLSRREIDGRLERLRELIDIGEALDHRMSTYSGGMKRRLDLAAALVHDPEILFLDEPTTGLDPNSRRVVWDEVRRLNQEYGTTIFLTTQYLEEADQLADRVGIIAQGRLVAEGPPADLKRQVGLDLVLVRVDGSPEMAAEAVRLLDGVDEVTFRDLELTIKTSDGSRLLGRVAVALSEAGIGVETLSHRAPTLDDVFMATTGHHMEVEQ